MSKYLIAGYGGIGSALASQLQQHNHSVTIISRKNITSFDSINFTDLKAFFNEQLPDYIINTIGVLHTNTHKPEKNIKQLTQQWLQESIEVNVMPTVIIAQLLSSVMQRNTKLKMLCLSARVSSISDNRLGGWYSYRMSKTALNMLIKNIAIEWSRSYPHAVIAGYHPGTVDTDLSKPYQANVPSDKLFTPEQAANYLLDVLQHMAVANSGCLFDWRGQVITP